MRPKKVVVPTRPWWVTEWLDLARQGGLKTRLQRGKMLASEGRVQSLQIEPGLLQGDIRMSPQITYHPTLQWAPLSDTKKETLLSGLESKPHLLAHLLNGQIDPEWKELFQSVGSELMPSFLEEIVMDCSCGDPQKLCTHLAALFQITSDEFEGRPASWFIFRGIPKEAWMYAQVESGSCELAEQEDFTASRFWEGQTIIPVPDSFSHPLAVLQGLGSFPLWQGQGRGPAEGLKEFYLAAAGNPDGLGNDENEE